MCRISALALHCVCTTAVKFRFPLPLHRRVAQRERELSRAREQVQRMKQQRTTVQQFLLTALTEVRVPWVWHAAARHGGHGPCHAHCSAMMPSHALALSARLSMRHVPWHTLPMLHWARMDLAGRSENGPRSIENCDVHACVDMPSLPCSGPGDSWGNR